MLLADAQKQFDNIISETMEDEALIEASRNGNNVFDAAKAVAHALIEKAQISVEDLPLMLAQLDDAIHDSLSENDFVMCDISADTIHIDHTVTIVHGNCGHDEAIVSERYSTFECNDCQRVFLSRNNSTVRNAVARTMATYSHTVNDNEVCQHCYENDYSSCSDCGDNYHSDNMRYHDASENFYCDGCYPTGMDEISNRLQLPPAATSHKDGLAVGWEIEFYPADRSEAPSSEHVERVYRDGSLRSEGREITTQPALPAQWDHRLSGLSDVLHHGSVEADCGGHLHVDARYLHKILWSHKTNVKLLEDENYYLDRIINNIRNLEAMSLSGSLPLEDNGATFANRYKENLEKIEKAKTADLLPQISPAIIYFQNVLRLLCERMRNESTYARPQRVTALSFDKYMALNITGLAHTAERKTVEFRLWDGCIDTKTLKFRAEICEAMVRKLTEIVEGLSSADDLIKQKASALISKFGGNDLQTNDGFWDVFDDAQQSFDEIKTLAKELQISEAWLTWAKNEIVSRCPDQAIAA